MSETLELWEIPLANEVYMIVGWRQWADAGSISSGLPQYLIQTTKSRQIGKIRSEKYYLFQFPGTHDLIRPVMKFNEGFPESLQMPSNEFYYSGDDQHGLVIFIGDEPHLAIEDYIGSLLEAVKTLKVKRIIGLGGVYGELPYDKERSISCNYSLKHLKDEMLKYAVRLSDYQGGASIGSYLCRRAGDINIEYVGFYGLVPAYNFTTIPQFNSAIRIENDFMAWLGIMQRVKHMLNLDISLQDLERRSRRLIQVVKDKVDELEGTNPQLGIREYMQRLSEEFTETIFDPLDEIWEEKLRHILDKFDDDKDTA